MPRVVRLQYAHVWSLYRWLRTQRAHRTLRTRRRAAGTGEGEISYEGKDVEAGGNIFVSDLFDISCIDYEVSDGGIVHHNTFFTNSEDEVVRMHILDGTRPDPSLMVITTNTCIITPITTYS